MRVSRGRPPTALRCASLSQHWTPLLRLRPVTCAQSSRTSYIDRTRDDHDGHDDHDNCDDCDDCDHVNRDRYHDHSDVQLQQLLISKFERPHN